MRQVAGQSECRTAREKNNCLKPIRTYLLTCVRRHSIDRLDKWYQLDCVMLVWAHVKGDGNLWKLEHIYYIFLLLVARVFWLSVLIWRDEYNSNSEYVYTSFKLNVLKPHFKICLIDSSSTNPYCNYSQMEIWPAFWKKIDIHQRMVLYGLNQTVWYPSRITLNTSYLLFVIQFCTLAKTLK